MGLNVYVPMGDYGFPSSADWLTLRYLGYSYNQKHGFKLGRLRGITLGQGLLVSDFVIMCVDF